jgi:hypothetical protein
MRLLYVLLTLLFIAAPKALCEPENAARAQAILASAIVSPMQVLSGNVKKYYVKKESNIIMPGGTSKRLDEVFVDGENERVSSYYASETKHLVVNKEGIFIITKNGIQIIDDTTFDLEEFRDLYSLIDISLDPSLNFVSPDINNALYTFEYAGNTYINEKEADIIKITSRERSLSTFNSVVYVSRPTNIVVRREVPGQHFVVNVLVAEKIKKFILPTVFEIYTAPNMKTTQTFTIKINPSLPKNTFNQQYLESTLTTSEKPSVK